MIFCLNDNIFVFFYLHIQNQRENNPRLHPKTFSIQQNLKIPRQQDKLHEREKFIQEQDQLLKEQVHLIDGQKKEMETLNEELYWLRDEMHDWITLMEQFQQQHHDQQMLQQLQRQLHLENEVLQEKPPSTATQQQQQQRKHQRQSQDDSYFILQSLTNGDKMPRLESNFVKCIISILEKASVDLHFFFVVDSAGKKFITKTMTNISNKGMAKSGFR